MCSSFFYDFRVILSANVFQLFWARIFKCLWGPGIDSQEWIPPAYVACGQVGQIGLSNRPNRLGIDFWAPEKVCKYGLCSSATLPASSPQRQWTRGLTRIGIFLTLAGGEGQGGMICFVMESCKSGLLGQGLLSCESMPIRAACKKNLHSSNSNYAWHARPVL